MKLYCVYGCTAWPARDCAPIPKGIPHLMLFSLSVAALETRAKRRAADAAKAARALEMEEERRRHAEVEKLAAAAARARCRRRRAAGAALGRSHHTCPAHVNVHRHHALFLSVTFRSLLERWVSGSLVRRACAPGQPAVATAAANSTRSGHSPVTLQRPGCMPTRPTPAMHRALFGR